MLLEHQGTIPASSTAEMSIHAQHSETRAGEMQPRGDDGKNKPEKNLFLTLERHLPATHRDKLKSFGVISAKS